MIFQRVATALTVVLVAGGVAAGFVAIGSPSRARTIVLDERRVNDLFAIADRLKDRGGPLPATLGGEAGLPRDPDTGAPYVYAKESPTRYRLCATFAIARGTDEPYPAQRHPEGPACYRFAKGGSAPVGTAFVAPPGAIR